MSDPFDGSADDLDELAVGRGDIDKTEVPDWLILSGCSARGLQLYQLLRLRLNRRRRSKKVWPGLATLAVMMKLKTSESVSPYVKELKLLGAIDVEPARMPRRNIYYIHFAPPEDYAGPMCIEDWDDNPANRLAVKRIRDAEKVKRDRTRGATAAKPQVSPEPGKNPDQARAGETVPPDPGKIRDQEPGKIPVLDPGKIRVESLGVTEGGSLDDRSSPASSEAQPVTADAYKVGNQDPQKTAEQHDQLPSEIEDQEGYTADGYPLDVTAWEADLIGELVGLRPDWGPRMTRIAVGHPSVRARTASNPGFVRRAFLMAAADRVRPQQGHRGTWTPKRLTDDRCPFWSRALAEMDVEAAAEAEIGQLGLEVPNPAVAERPPRPREGQRAVPFAKKGATSEYLAARAELDAKLDSQRASASA